MKKITTILLLILIIASQSFAQEKIKTKQLKIENGFDKEYINVTKDNEDIKEGKYRYYFDDELLISGQYHNNLKSGKWEYFIGIEGVSFSGNFLDGEKDDIWEYYMNTETMSRLHYSNGELDSLHSIFEDGSIATRKVYTDDTVFILNFYNNGSLLSTYKYVKGRYDGTVELYFKNGQLHQELIYEQGSLINVPLSYDEKGNELDKGTIVDGNGTYKSYFFLQLEESPKVVIETMRTFKDGEMDGEYLKYSYEGKVIGMGNFETSYKVGNWIEQNYMGESKEKEYNLADSVGYFVGIRPDAQLWSEHPPAFPLGDAKRNRYLSRNIKYPEYERGNRIQGLVVVNFVIEKDGEITRVNVLKGVAKALDEEAMRVVKAMPIWQPGIQHGMPVRVYVNLPIRFTLN